MLGRLLFFERLGWIFHFHGAPLRQLAGDDETDEVHFCENGWNKQDELEQMPSTETDPTGVPRMQIKVVATARRLAINLKIFKVNILHAMSRVVPANQRN